MNKKVFKTMIALVVIFLVACYVLKIFFPEQFALSLENNTLVNIGNYMDKNLWIRYPFGVLTSFITYWLYLCATCRKWYLKWWECLIVLVTIGATIGLRFVDTNLSSVISYTSFVFLPFMFKAELKPVAICYTIHITNQFLTLSIRNLIAYVATVNALNIMILSIDMYMWLVLLYITFNYKTKNKEVKTMGWELPPVYGKDEHRIDKKIARLSNKIARLSEEKAIYEERKAKLPKKEAPKA